MDVTQLPYNKFIGLKFSDDPDYLLMLDSMSEYRNHLDTVHASALFALAEATSSHFLLNEFSELTDIVPVVRKVDVKYRKSAEGKIFSKAKLSDTTKGEIIDSLREKKRALLKVEVFLFDPNNKLVMQSGFEWFITSL